MLLLDKVWERLDSALKPARAALLPRLKRLAHERLNPVMLHVAGRRFSPIGILYHTGRRSGRRYAVPLLPAIRGNTFVFTVSHGPRTDWYRNVLAQGGCQFRWHGKTLMLGHPQTLGRQRGLSAFNIPERAILLIEGAELFLALKKVQ